MRGEGLAEEDPRADELLAGPSRAPYMHRAERPRGPRDPGPVARRAERLEALAQDRVGTDLVARRGVAAGEGRARVAGAGLRLIGRPPPRPRRRRRLAAQR